MQKQLSQQLKANANTKLKKPTGLSNMVSHNIQNMDSKLGNSLREDLIHAQHSLQDDNMMRRLELAERSDDSGESPVIT